MATPAHQIENQMVLPESAPMPTVRSKTNTQILEDSALWVADKPQHLEQMPDCIDHLINEDHFSAVIIRLLDSRTSMKQLKHLRKYMRDKAFEIEAAKRGGEFTAVLEVAS